ncbi:MAG: META domain-containing protein [Planctomycetes bacterium]|nr:META domain-containing protein [Planctomycetota bacterium]
MRLRSSTWLPLLALAACSSPAPPLPDLDRLDGSAWTVIALDGTPLLAQIEATLRFEAERASGSGGANRWFSSWKRDGAHLVFGPIGATRSFRDDPKGTMAQEQRYLAALAATDGVRLEGRELVLLAAGVERVRLALVAPAE